MHIFLTIITLIFFFVSHNIYRNLCEPYISNFYLNIIIYILLLIVGQSFWLLFNQHLNRFLEYLIYIVIFTFSFMFIYYLIIDIIRLFYLKNNIQILDFNVLTFAVLLSLYGFFNRYFIRTTVYNLETDKNIELKIAFASDLHIGDTGINRNILNKMVKKINAQNVDLVIFGGDIIERDYRAFTKNQFNEIFKNIKTKYGVFAVLGNHEYYGGGPYEIADTLENDGNIKVLNDEKVVFDNFILIGREDNSKRIFGKNRKSLVEILDNIDISNKFTIVADHNPINFNESVDNEVDLQISGHTHNGQFFPFNLVIKFFYEKPYGLLNKGKSNLITSSGLSTWRIPIKLGSKPEIVIVNIKPKSEHKNRKLNIFNFL